MKVYVQTGDKVFLPVIYCSGGNEIFLGYNEQQLLIMFSLKSRALSIAVIVGKSLKITQKQNAKSRTTSATTTLRTRISSRFSRNR